MHIKSDLFIFLLFSFVAWRLEEFFCISYIFFFFFFWVDKIWVLGLVWVLGLGRGQGIGIGIGNWAIGNSLENLWWGGVLLSSGTYLYGKSVFFWGGFLYR